MVRYDSYTDSFIPINFDEYTIQVEVSGKSIGEIADAVVRKLVDSQGEWIVDISDYKSVCSVCGADETDFVYGTEIWYGLGESKFCPNCGARMKGNKKWTSIQEIGE